MKVPCFHRIEVPFLQNLSALFGQCPLTFEVLPRPLNEQQQEINNQSEESKRGSHCASYDYRLGEVA